MGKRRCANTLGNSILKTRYLAKDRLPHSELKMYVASLILREKVELDNREERVRYSCGQNSCKAL